MEHIENEISLRDLYRAGYKMAVEQKDGEITVKAIKVKEMVIELLRAFVYDDEVETSEIVKDRLTALMDFKFKKAIDDSEPDAITVAVPEEFKCPLSGRLMRKAVLLPSGVTYDDHCIATRWSMTGKFTCPITKKELSGSAVIPNYRIRQMIRSWYFIHEISITELSVTERNPSLTDFLKCMEKHKCNLVEKLMAELPNSSPELQEVRINWIMNICFHDSQVMIRIAHTPDKKILIAHATEQGKKLMRPINEPAKKAIVAMRSLISLLAQGNDLEMVEAVTGIYSCLGLSKYDFKGKAIDEGLIKLVLQKIRDKILRNHMLEILAYLSTDARAISTLVRYDAIQCLLEIIRESPGQPYEENCAVILQSICCTYPCMMREIIEEESEHQTLSRLVQEGTSRAKRKASSILAMMVSAMEEELKKSRDEVSYSRIKCERLEKELKHTRDYEQHMNPKGMKVISDLLMSVSKAERQEARMIVRQDILRLGNIGVVRADTILSETWEDGQAMEDINAHLRSLLEVKEGIERHRKSLKKRPRDKGEVADADGRVQEEDILMQDEIFESRLASIKREEEAVLHERERHELEKGRLIREMKRIRDEDDSRFNNFQILNGRYALLNLLGKGGFSEVYKAFDLVEYRYVACKLHGLSAQWSEEKKQSYIQHAIRKYNILKTLVHRHIVRLWDIFEIDHSTFCTVLEYCSGKDLDAVLKATPVLPEREARIILVQIFQCLVYLNKRSVKIIHYDLKPGNVLFDEFGIAKVTDFGLSKIVEDNVGSQGVEITSHGAGTYWYLPPECFELNRIPLISSKVDVWSLGVLLYQMLFGRRPFGHDKSQERILCEDTIIQPPKVEFPSRPSVSNEAKDFICRCLTYNQAERPDVLAIAQDPYVIYTKK
ncbi:serine/threonine-protein kinase TOUSLED-like [Salvia hispanica]|uniref:serine/threonine-protein kinase TOUSLED-like n=1 Tax=Salvia hispanica TaxID=49212 RepID=UPI0020094165|nr:serine/threonine-protein kinase TOUSLED-like [Salvia hispanica]